MKFRKRPVVIEAMHYEGGVPSDELGEWLAACIWNHGTNDARLRLYTLEGWMTVNPGDWVIKGVRGEFYPCKPDIFAETYEAVA